MRLKRSKYTFSSTDFNPRTHVGCDRGERQYCPCISISIHAPTWGATYRQSASIPHSCISIHAPTWGATYGTQNALSRQVISIHAPTWGATIPNKSGFDLSHISIHAPTWGATGCESRSHGAFLFQSTHPRGVRLIALYICTIYAHVSIISIHAPTWGATVTGKGLTQHVKISIHAPTWGATPHYQG